MSPNPSSNTIRALRTYDYYGQWVFDDPNTNLVREAFVGGTDAIIDMATARIPNAKEGFLLLFSHAPFPGANVVLNWVREEAGGNIYRWEHEGEDHEGWLCPSLLAYFETPPATIYALAKAID